MTSSSDTFAWLDKVIHEHQVRGQEYSYSNEKDRMMQALMEENEFLKSKLMQYENGIYNQELKAKIGELEDEKKEMFIRFKEISILKEKQIELLNEKIESMKRIMNDEMEPLSNVPNEKDTLTQYLKVINDFLDKINHHLVNYSSTPLNEKDKGNEIAILEAKFKIIEYVLQQNEVSNDNHNKDNKENPILNTRNQSNQFNSSNSIQSGESNKSKRSNQSNNRKKGNIK